MNSQLLEFEALLRLGNTCHSSGGRQTNFLVRLSVALLVGKLAGCGAGAFFNGFDTRESLIVGAGMIPRGAVGSITASLGWVAGIVTRNICVQVAAMGLASTLITPGLLRFAFLRYALAEAAAAGSGIGNILEDVANLVTRPGNV